MAEWREIEDVLIVGAGPIGLACAISAKRRGLDPLVIDAGALVNSIVHYPVGMTFFTTPDLLEIGGHPLTCAGQKPTREEVLKYYRGIVRAEALRVRTYTRLLGASAESGAVRCALETALGPAIHPHLFKHSDDQQPFGSHPPLRKSATSSRNTHLADHFSKCSRQA